MNDILKITKALEDSDILLKGITKIIKNETKEQKGGFLSILLDTLSTTLFGNMLAGKGIVRAGYRYKQGEGIVKAGHGSSVKKKSLIPPQPLTTFEIQKHYQNEPRFNSFYSRDKLPMYICNKS